MMTLQHPDEPTVALREWDNLPLSIVVRQGVDVVIAHSRCVEDPGRCADMAPNGFGEGGVVFSFKDNL